MQIACYLDSAKKKLRGTPVQGQCIMKERHRVEARQISWRMALYLEGKIPVDANDLSPKEATEMSRDIMVGDEHR